MRYFEFRIQPVADDPTIDKIMAFLLDLGFESFCEEEDTLIAYLPESLYQPDILAEQGFIDHFPGLTFTALMVEDKNWNEEWEKNYRPVLIAGRCHVRAPFHSPMAGIPFDIVIEPKMAFGTAHHETTQLMAAWLMELDVEGKQVLDMGCGTGILAVLANKMGAGYVIGIDNDEWAWQNARENLSLNGVEKGEVIPGDAQQIGTARFDLILANINRNILLQDMESYSRGLKNGGMILFSGFYESDRDHIEMAAKKVGLKNSGIRTLNQWAVMLFTKELE